MPDDFEVAKWRSDLEDRAAGRALALTLARRQVLISVLTILISAFGIGVTYWLGGRNLDAAIASSERNARVTQENAAESAKTSISIANANLTALQETADKNAREARKSLEEKWRLDLLDDQRKAMQSHTVEFMQALLKATALAQEITSHARLGETPSLEQLRNYDRLQRENISIMENAEIKVFVESKDMSFLFRPLRANFKDLDEELLRFGMSQGSYSKELQSAEWCSLDVRLLEFDIIPALNKISEATKRPGIAYSKIVGIKAPPLKRPLTADQLIKDIISNCGRLVIRGVVLKSK